MTDLKGTVLDMILRGKGQTARFKAPGGDYNWKEKAQGEIVAKETKRHSQTSIAHIEGRNLVIDVSRHSGHFNATFRWYRHNWQALSKAGFVLHRLDKVTSKH